MFYFLDRYDAFPASPMALNDMETLICNASAMTYCCCIPRDMNHPMSNNFNNNTYYIMFTDTLLKIFFLGYKQLGCRFPSIWKRSSVMDRRCMHDKHLSIIWKPLLTFTERLRSITAKIGQALGRSLYLGFTIMWFFVGEAMLPPLFSASLYGKFGL